MAEHAAPLLDDEPDTAPQPAEVLFARQPLLDVRGRLAGYELLHRGEAADGPHAATSRIAARALSDVGLRSWTGGTTAYLNVTPEFLLAMDPLPFGPEAVVLELVPERSPDDALIDRLIRLRAHGYTVAIDGFLGQPAAVPLLDVAGAAKVDVREAGAIQVAALVEQLRAAGLRAIACNVDDHLTHDRCAELGYELFQGDVIARPRAVVGEQVPASRAAQLRLAADVADPSAGVDELERAISLDPGLSLRLLRFVNSAAFSMRHEIRSVRQAVVLLGPPTVRQWSLLLLLADLGDRSDTLVLRALARARMCESLARHLGAPDVEAYFFTGMLSTVDALLDVPMPQVVAGLPLAEDVVAALVDRTGGKGRTLVMAEACERGSWDEAALPTLDAATLAVLHVEALTWADAIAGGMV